jgi:hypothetical protein
MRILYILLPLCLAVGGLSAAPVPPLQVQEEIVTPFMTLEWTFSTENLSGEFAVDRIRTLQIGPRNELIIFDDDAIQVFDRQGNPICILRDSTGAVLPSRIRGNVGPTGFMTIVDGLPPVLGYLISPDFTCIRIQEYPYPSPWADLVAERDLNMRDYPSTSITISEEVIVFTVDGGKRRGRGQRGTSERWSALLLEDHGTYHLIAAYPDVGVISTGPGTGFGFPDFGRLLYQILSSDRIVYTHGAHDRTGYGDQAAFTLHIRSLDDQTQTDITHPYEPVTITAEELIETMLSISGGTFDPDDPENRERYRTFYEKVEEYPFKSPVRDIFTDGQYIFVLTYSRDDAGGILTYVFDAGTCSHKCTTVVPWPRDREWRLSGIRNGYAYAVIDWMGVGGPPGVERYRVNPGIYSR